MPKGTPSPPRSRENPIGHVRMQRRTVQRLRRGLRDVQAWTLERFQQIPRQRIEVNALHFNASRYEYQIDAAELQLIVDEIRRRLGQDVPADYLAQQVAQAYEAGTGEAVAQLAALTDDYTRDITQVLSSEPWQRRVALIRARQFELMSGFHGDTATDLGRVLSQAVQDGINPRDVVSTLRERFGVSRSRATRIARTEMTTALRRASWDESQDASERLGIRNKLVWYSALSPTTRASHASKHGRTFTQQDVREFYSQGGESINCKCSQSPVLLDENGDPMMGRLEGRLAEQRKGFDPN